MAEFPYQCKGAVTTILRSGPEIFKPPDAGRTGNGRDETETDPISGISAEFDPVYPSAQNLMKSNGNMSQNRKIFGAPAARF